MADEKKAYLNTVLHQLHELGTVTSKAMFGGYGLYCEGVFFGLIAENRLYFATDDTSRPDYVAKGAEPFGFKVNQKRSRTYFSVPADIFDDPSQLAEWAREAVEIKSSRKIRPKG